ncbi:uncharacterized protein ATNIH1004_009713 [Aspergillus tanneri]|uniref:NAD(P)-binding domain-containing protein n=1 Tax=Aspergillus tanneri TaxID=1220188 RepID=A0A5M9M870_9EURO|nr:uncharacterized protein ATNIH1004_009713 [Aspergillus tanneri]KAA8642951.1 hypothetical protein ATNIH1004_009713 [Aspergillus tanneri]
MTLKYLITGASGGLGAHDLDCFVANWPLSEFATASSKESKKATAIEGVDNLFFVSTNVLDNERRKKQHGNFIDPARKVGVKHVWYTSLALSGFKSDSQAAMLRTHYETEDLLKESGLTYTSIREGAYAYASLPSLIGFLIH